MDKRTKRYKEQQKKLQDKIDNKEAFVDKGLGDKIEEIAAKTGIKKAVKKVFGEDCGCKERKEKLNSKIRFRFPIVRCFTEEQFNQWTDFKAERLKGNSWVNVTREEQISVMIPLYAHLFARQLKPLNCCLDLYLNEINKVFEL